MARGAKEIHLSGMEENIKALADAIYADKVRRARAGCDALVVSLGRDAHRDEPRGFLGVGDDGFARAGEAVRGLGLPCAVVQEGGYNTEAIGVLLGRFLGGLVG
jgi:acetoin utilization deacetylase AcuC-like enzyme